MKKLLTLICITSALAVSAKAQVVILNETFSYATGPLVGAAGSPWTTHSGTAGQVDVTAGGLVNITGSESEDVSTPWTTPTVYTDGVLSANLDINFSALPSATTTYFTHFKDATASGFRGRVFATITGATSGSFRLGIANTTTTFVSVPVDLSLGTTYTMNLSLDVATGVSTLTVLGTSVTATDATTPLAISTYAFRQSGGEGTLTADNLVVSYTAAAVPEPSTYAMIVGGAGLLFVVSRRKSRMSA